MRTRPSLLHAGVPLLLAFWGGAATALPSSLGAQQSQLTAADYQRAERFLAQATFPLVSGAAAGFTWLADGRVGTAPASRADSSSAWPTGTAHRGRRVRPWTDGQSDLHRDGDELGADAPSSGRPHSRRSTGHGGRRLPHVCLHPADLFVLRDDQRDGRSPARPGAGHSSQSPDGRYAAYIRDYNLWVRKDLITAPGPRLTTDGARDFGYATNNAGWIRSPEPGAAWSPDAALSPPSSTTARGVVEMYLATAHVGAPRARGVEVPAAGRQRHLPDLARDRYDVEGPGAPR